MSYVRRADHATKPGGDDVQLERYAGLMRERGVEVEYVTSAREARGEIVHLFNLDRPYDLLRDIHAVNSSARLIISPIFHSPAGVSRLRRAEMKLGVRGWVSIVPDRFRHLLTFVGRARRRGMGLAALVSDSLWALRAALGLRSRLRAAFQKASVILVLSATEEAQVRDFLRIGGERFHLVPNGDVGTQVDSPGGWSARSTGLMCVGRIEPRKRQLELACVCAERKIHIDFYGAVNANWGVYARRFLKVVRSSEFVEWRGQVPHESIVAAMGATRVLMNVSWVEVQSLVDIEAASAGAWVVATRFGSSAERIGPGAVEVDPAELGRAVDLAQRLAKSGPPPSLRPYSWSNVGRELYAVYESA